MLCALIGFMLGKMIGRVIKPFCAQVETSQTSAPARPAPESVAKPTFCPNVQDTRPPVTGVDPIPPFGGRFFSLPRKSRRCNDDVFLDHYKRDVPRFPGLHRKGIHEPLGGCRDYAGRVRQDLKWGFPYSKYPPAVGDEGRCCIRA